MRINSPKLLEGVFSQPVERLQAIAEQLEKTGTSPRRLSPNYSRSSMLRPMLPPAWRSEQPSCLAPPPRSSGLFCCFRGSAPGHLLPDLPTPAASSAPSHHSIFGAASTTSTYREFHESMNNIRFSVNETFLTWFCPHSHCAADIGRSQRYLYSSSISESL